MTDEKTTGDKIADEKTPEGAPGATPDAAAMAADMAAPEGQSTPANDAAPAAEIDPLTQAQAEIAQLKDQLLRTMAEAENSRRRTQRDKDEAVKFAAARFAQELLGVADNLGRALAAVPADAAEKDPALKALMEGVAATDRQLAAVFEKFGLKRVEPLGEKFDAHFHQAMFELPGSGQPAGTVVQVMQAGYVMHERLLRPALVGVAKAEAPAAANETPGA